MMDIIVHGKSGLTLRKTSTMKLLAMRLSTVSNQCSAANLETELAAIFAS